MRAHMAIIGSLVLLLGACGNSEPEVVPPVGQGLCKSSVGEGPAVGMAYDVGGRNDLGINDSAFDGLTRAVHKFHATCIEAEAAGGELPSARVNRLNQLIDTGATVIVAVGGTYSDAVDKVARANPKVHFAVIDTPDSDAEHPQNVARLDFAVDEGAYLAGVAAALASKSKTVGFIGGLPSRLVDAYQSGFDAGARAAVPDVKVLITRQKPVDDDFALKKASRLAATDQFDRGADVVFGADGVSEAGLFNAAVDAGDDHWAIGVNSDQFLTATGDQKPHVLTSVVKRSDVPTYEFIKSVAQGKPINGSRTYDLEEGGVEYARSGGFVKPISRRLDKFEKRLEDGEVQIPSPPAA